MNNFIDNLKSEIKIKFPHAEIQLGADDDSLLGYALQFNPYWYILVEEIEKSEFFLLSYM